MKTAPRTGRKEVEKQAAHIADYWRSVRVGVTQAAPGRLIVRALRADPLAEPFGPEQCPPGTYAAPPPHVLYVGRDDFGNDRYLPLRGLTGICVSGLPGYGKTILIASWLCQLTTTPAAQFALLDGKDGGDQEPWHDRAWRHAGDQLADALDVLEDAARRDAPPPSTRSPTCAASATPGTPPDPPRTCRCWSPSSTSARPTSTSPSTKATAPLEGLTRRCIALTGELIRKGRSVLCLTILATQKTTGDSIPTSLRDNSGLAVSFALKTTESSVAALGDAIREYPGYQPDPPARDTRTASAPPSPPSPPAPTRSPGSASPRSPNTGPPNAPPLPPPPPRPARPLCLRPSSYRQVRNDCPATDSSRIRPTAGDT